MSPQDIADAKALAGDNDDWNTAIDDGLQTSVGAQSIGVDQPAEITDDAIAVDSLALSAVGGGTGYVAMITGNGSNVDPAAPVSIEIFKVAAPLDRGALKIVESSNPLDEKLTLRQSNDFAGDPEDYEFEWVSAQPVNGSAPPNPGSAGEQAQPGGAG